jgi:hypothetical protein
MYVLDDGSPGVHHIAGDGKTRSVGTLIIVGRNECLSGQLHSPKGHDRLVPEEAKNEPLKAHALLTKLAT